MQPNLTNDFHPSPMNRRQWLSRMGMGMGGMGLASLLSTTNSFANTEVKSSNPLEPRGPHFPAKAKRVIHLFMNGGPSHVDTFDPKPELTRQHGKPLARPNLGTERKTGAALGSPFKFTKHGQSGLEISSLFPHVARMADDLCVIRSMHGDVPNHEPSLLLLNCGDARQIRPSMGSWITYGLGAENQNLPGFIAMCPDGYPIQETQNWQSAFLPGVFQGTYINTRHTDIDKLVENIRNARLPLSQQRRQLDLVARLNARHMDQHKGDSALESRIQSFELAYRMQMDAADAFDVNRETKQTLDLYGPGLQARQMIIARRLLERGVRFVQVWHGAGQPWDSHDDLEFNHKNLAKECDQAIGALLFDLKQRGMLEDTLVLWGGEFGRTPTVELPTPGANQGKINGRDHNHWGFTMWMAGGGAKGGYAHGATDEFGFQAVEKKVHFHDLQATIMHLLGFDHERLTYRFAGRDFRLTDLYGNVVRDLIA